MKFLRIIFSDQNGPEQFSVPAKEKEWAIPATCIFSQFTPDTPRAADHLVSAWLGSETFGFSRLAEVAEITPKEFQIVINRLAHFLVEQNLARDLDEAFAKATEEADHTAKLANRDVGSILMVDRVMTKHGVSETFKTVPMA